MEFILRIDWTNIREALCVFGLMYVINAVFAAIPFRGDDWKLYASWLSVPLPKAVQLPLCLTMLRNYQRAVPLVLQLLNIGLFVTARFVNVQGNAVYNGLYFFIIWGNLLALVGELIYFHISVGSDYRNHRLYSYKAHPWKSYKYRDVTRYR